MANTETRKPRGAPIERFIWREGDLRVIHDPCEDRTRREEGSLDDPGQASLEQRDRRRDA